MTAALEDVKTIDLNEWGTLNTAASPTKLPAGQTPDAQNVWVDEKPGSVITAPGYRKVGTITSDNPVTMCINYFKASTGTQTFVVSDNSTVYTTTDFQTFTSIITGLSSAFQLRGLVIRDKLWLTNGSDAVRVWDGSSVTVLDGAGTTPDVPKGRYIAYHDERVWMYHVSGNRSQAAFSALTNDSGTIIAPDNEDAWPASNTLQISEGDADFGTGMVIFRGYLYFFKQYSVWRLIGYDEYTYTRVKCRASTGTRFNESIQVVDSLVNFIGLDGIYVFDGEDAERISDIIDPASATQASFGFNQLQQPSTNTQFWETLTTADWNLGTKMTNVAVDDSLTLSPCDNSQADFAAGALLTNMDTSTNAGSLQLAAVASGSVGALVSSGATVNLPWGIQGQTGQTHYLTDGNLTNAFGGWDKAGATHLGSWNPVIEVVLSEQRYVGTIILRNVYVSSATDFTVGLQPFYIYAYRYDSSYEDPGRTYLGAFTVTPTLVGGNYVLSGDLTLNFNSVYGTRFFISLGYRSGLSFTLSEIEIYNAGFQSTGKFISKTLDYGVAPASFGNFNADVTTNSQTITYFTQSSADGSSWNAEVACTNGGAIGSALARYIRWGAYFNSATGEYSPVISDVYLGSMYLSKVHNTGGSIFAWGALEADYFLAAQQIKFYYRAATTEGGVAAASWSEIVPGGVPTTAVANVYFQFKIEFLGGTATTVPHVDSVTVNWVKGSGIDVQTLQNVASFAWRNRYWLSAASDGATENDTILIRGKKTFGSPWQLKDWHILSFCRFQDNLYGGSSEDGSIYILDSGYSADGSALDAYFQTGDFTFGGQYIGCSEIVVEVERKGPYNLTVGVSIDRGTSWTDYNVDLTESTYAPSYIKRLNINVNTTDRIRFRVRINAVDQPFEVHNLRAYYQISPARGSIL